MTYPLSRIMSAASAAYGGYALAQPSHLWQALQSDREDQSGLELLARTYGVRDTAISALGLAACSGGGGGPQTGGASKLTNDKIVIGLLSDQSGVYKDLSGPNSAAALAVATQAKAKKKLYINIGAGTTALTGAQCNKYTFHWAYDTAVLAKGTAGTIVGEGGKTWNIVYPDYAFGQDMNKSFSAEVKTAGGTVGQSIATPFPSDNFATFITKAGDGSPQVVGTMHAGGDLINFVKQYNQSELKGKSELAVGLMFITDIHSLGVDQFAGTQFTDAWYWNFDEQNRAWADKFTAKTQTRPSFAHAANYSAALNYLEAVQAAGTDDADTIVKSLEGKKINDFFLRNGEVRAADHNITHDVYLAKVKTKDQVKEAWDYEEITKTVPAAQAYAAPDGSCKLS